MREGLLSAPGVLTEHTPAAERDQRALREARVLDARALEEQAPRMTRVLVLVHDKRVRRYPLPDDVPLRDSYVIDGLEWTVVDVIPPSRIEP